MAGSKPGPARTPKSIQKSKGRSHHKDDGRKDAPESNLKEPRAPKWLTPPAKRIYHRICKRLTELRVLDSIDSGALERYSATFAEWRICQKSIDEVGIKQSLRLSSKMVRHAGALSKELRAIEAQFGLTPSARESLTTPNNPPAQPPTKGSKLTDKENVLKFRKKAQND